MLAGESLSLAVFSSSFCPFSFSHFFCAPLSSHLFPPSLSYTFLSAFYLLSLVSLFGRLRQVRTWWKSNHVILKDLMRTEFRQTFPGGAQCHTWIKLLKMVGTAAFLSVPKLSVFTHIVFVFICVCDNLCACVRVSACASMCMSTCVCTCIYVCFYDPN